MAVRASAKKYKMGSNEVPNPHEKWVNVSERFYQRYQFPNYCEELKHCVSHSVSHQATKLRCRTGSPPRGVSWVTLNDLQPFQSFILLGFYLCWTQT